MFNKIQTAVKIHLAYFFLVATTLFGCQPNQDSESSETSPAVAIQSPINGTYNIVEIYPHNTSSFTQGLIWHNNTLYEGTGLTSQSKLFKTELATGKALQTLSIADTLFGEGITIYNNKIYQLTWQNHKVLVYDVNTFKKEKELNWNYEGWGITHFNNQLIISTGSSNLYFVNPATLAIEKTLGVYDNNGYIASLNELEMIDGKIYANVWGENKIIAINPSSGQVEKQFDFTNILQRTNQPITTETNVLNGIAYDSVTKAAYITGKNWPAIFKVTLQ
jgi:glutamine cyclotransferase